MNKLALQLTQFHYLCPLVGVVPRTVTTRKYMSKGAQEPVLRQRWDDCELGGELVLDLEWGHFSVRVVLGGVQVHVHGAEV
jgi:hypothetical protein